MNKIIKKPKHKTLEELNIEIKEIKEENEKLKSLIRDIMEILEKHL